MTSLGRRFDDQDVSPATIHVRFNKKKLQLPRSHTHITHYDEYNSLAVARTLLQRREFANEDYHDNSFVLRWFDKLPFASYTNSNNNAAIHSDISLTTIRQRQFVKGM